MQDRMNEKCKCYYVLRPLAAFFCDSARFLNNAFLDLPESLVSCLFADLFLSM